MGDGRRIRGRYEYEDELAANSGDEKDCRGRSKVPVESRRVRWKCVRKVVLVYKKPIKASWSHPNVGRVAELTKMQQSLGSAAIMQNLLSQLQGPKRNATVVVHLSP